MKKIILSIVICVIAFITISAIALKESKLTTNFIVGNPEIASINALSFGPEGILFIGDSKNASVYAIDTKDRVLNENAEKVNIDNLDTKIAASLGTTTDNIRVTDMAVNPTSKTIYFSINIGDGTPVVLKLNGEVFENVSLKDVSYSKMELKDAISVDAKDRRGRSQRTWTISDLKYHKGKVMVTGLSNKEFGSTFRSIPFPFNNEQDYASLEIYHTAHGRYETQAPIKTFNIINIQNKDYLLASYTCTPLVLFPVDELQNGKHVKGNTVAELGAGNSPLDMITFEIDGKSKFLISNTNRPVMIISYDEIINFKESLTKPVEGFGTGGVPYVSLPLVNVLEMDKLDDTHVVFMQRNSRGQLILRSNRTEGL